MGYQIYALNSTCLEDGPCDPAADVPKVEYTSCISGRTLQKVPTVTTYHVDGYNALQTAGEVRTWITEVQACLEWIKERRVENMDLTLTENNVIKASSADDGQSTQAYRINNMMEHCRRCEEWGYWKWTASRACRDLQYEIDELESIADWLVENQGKQFDHSY